MAIAMAISDAACAGDCGSTLVKRSFPPIRAAIAISSIPLVITFALVAAFAFHKLFPLLSGQASLKSSPRKHDSISVNNASFRPSAPTVSAILRCVTLERAAAVTFSTTIALSAVLAELIFFEISDVLNSAARSVALEFTISILLLSLVIVTPALEIHSLISSQLRGSRQCNALLAVLFDSIGLSCWLGTFWWIGRAVLGPHNHASPHEHGFNEGSLKRIAVLGIFLMGSLAGFAAVSSIWQTFGVKQRKVSETDIIRRQTGLQSTADLLSVKASRLRALERKVGATSKTPLFTRVANQIWRSDSTSQEITLLRAEVLGLETMKASLSSSLQLLRSRRDSQKRASTAVGRVCVTASHVFSIYCIYRITAASVATFRRWKSPSTAFSNSDPINNVLALLVRIWDPALDRDAWSRQISFLLSGLMLLASFNAVLQTVLLFSRFMPLQLQHSAQQNLALLVSQICATYVVSSALLLRSNLPKEMGHVIEGALRTPLDTAFVERWFETWFLSTCAVTALGIWMSRKISGTADWDDDIENMDIEAGKEH